MIYKFVFVCLFVCFLPPAAKNVCGYIINPRCSFYTLPQYSSENTSKVREIEVMDLSGCNNTFLSKILIFFSVVKPFNQKIHLIATSMELNAPYDGRQSLIKAALLHASTCQMCMSWVGWQVMDERKLLLN